MINPVEMLGRAIGQESMDTRLERIVQEAISVPANSEPTDEIAVREISKPTGTAGTIWRHAYHEGETGASDEAREFARVIFQNKGVIPSNEVKKLNASSIPFGAIAEIQPNGDIIYPQIVEAFEKQHQTYPVFTPEVTYSQ